MKVLITYLWVISALLLSLNSQVKGQAVIGMSKEEIRVFMKEKHRGFRLDNSVVKQRFNYLKYVNGRRTRTWIFFFTEKDLCKTSKKVCDYSEFDDVMIELNKTYETGGESGWVYVLDRDTVQVILTRQEWYFTVREAIKK